MIVKYGYGHYGVVTGVNEGEFISVFPANRSHALRECLEKSAIDGNPDTLSDLISEMQTFENYLEVVASEL